MKIAVQNLSKRFPSRNKKGQEVIAVDHFNVEFPDGKLVGLLGPSGCGKSTALNLLSGLLEPSEGSIFFGDEEVTHVPPEQRGVGLVFQNYALYPHLTVRQNILFPLENRKGKERLSKAEMEEKAMEAAKLVQIDALMDRKPAELSGGQQQRVAIARALVKMPRVLLMDEPLSNLDARLRLQTREELRRIQRETGITTIFVTHDQEEAMSISDQIIVMNAGVIQQIGKPQQVYDEPANLFVAKFLGTPPINVFHAKVEQGRLWIGKDAVLDVPEVEEQELWAAVRPEGFVLSKEGCFRCDLQEVEVMGRDISVLCRHEGSEQPVIRAIISAEQAKEVQEGSNGGSVAFDLKAEKLFLFRKEDGLRVPLRQGV